MNSNGLRWPHLVSREPREALLHAESGGGWPSGPSPGSSIGPGRRYARGADHPVWAMRERRCIARRLSPVTASGILPPRRIVT